MIESESYRVKLNELLTEFTYYLIEHPDFFENIPYSAQVVVLDRHDPEYSRQAIEHAQMARQVDDVPERPVAYIKIGYNPSTRKNCAFIQKSTTNHSYGAASSISITLRMQSDAGTYANDHGDYKYYAGPVYLTAPNTCVSADGWEAWAGSWQTPWTACG